jgi:adenylate cyclase
LFNWKNEWKIHQIDHSFSFFSKHYSRLKILKHNQGPFSMKLYIKILAFIFAINSSPAQDIGKSKIDSLKKQLLIAVEDTHKVKLLGRISMVYRNTDYKQALNYLKTAEALAIKLNYNDGIADCNYYLGNIYLEHSDFTAALNSFNKALEIRTAQGNKKLMPPLLHNIAYVYNSLGNYPKAIEINLNSLKLFEEIGNKEGTANCYVNISNIFSFAGNSEKFLLYNQKANKIYTEIGSKSGIAVTLNNIGSYYTTIPDIKKSNEYFKKSLAIYEELKNAEGMDLASINLAMSNLDQGDYNKALDFAFRALNIVKTNDMPEEIGYDFMIISEIYYRMGKDDKLNKTNSKQIMDKHAAFKLSDAYIDSSMVILSDLKLLNEYSQAAEIKANIGFATGNYKQAYENFKLFKTLSDSIFNLEKNKKITQSAMQYDFDKKEAKSKAENEKQAIKQRNIRNTITIGLIGALIFLLVVYRQRNKISIEKARSEELLLNILPHEVAEELKDKGSAAAKNFEQVTVLFTDFKGFTQLSEKLSPAELVAEINHCFSAFDYIMQKHNIEKIKTIGDAYMAAGGLPKANDTHATDVVSAALEIQQYMKEHKQSKESKGELFFEIRIGVHTGPVVAGIVGVKKFAYDIWGDTVNTASRMESSGEVGKVNISGATYDLVKDQFHCKHRGKILAKNKGEIDMYFVEARS